MKIVIITKPHYEPGFGQFKEYIRIKTTGHTPWKINMEHENGGLEDDVLFQLGDF